MQAVQSARANAGGIGYTDANPQVSSLTPDAGLLTSTADHTSHGPP